MASAASTARADLGFSLIDTGAPQVSTDLDPSGIMQGYTGYLLRLTSDSTTIGGYAFDYPISGNFAQIWTASRGKAISGGKGYNTWSPGLSLANNSDPEELWNADSHFLGNQSQTLTNVTENGTFLTGSNLNPLEQYSTDYYGFGLGTQMKGLVAFTGTNGTQSVDVAYLVVPNGSPISFVNAQVTLSNFDSYLVSYQNINAHSSWTLNGGGSWSDASHWLGGATVCNFKTTTGGIPHALGDTANFDGVITAPSTVTLDGEKTVSYVEFKTLGPVTIAQGTGGSLTFVDGGVIGRGAGLDVRSGRQVIAAPVRLQSNLRIWQSSLQDHSSIAPTLLISGDISSDSTTLTSLEVTNAGGFYYLGDKGPGLKVTLTGTNTYTGSTIINSSDALQIGDGGTSGTLGQGPVIFPAAVPGQGPANLTFNRSDTYVVNNDISGLGNIIQAGSGTPGSYGR